MEEKTNISSEQKLKIMLYSLEEYDRKQYERYREQFQMKFLKNRLDENTAVYSFDCDAVIACPMDNITEKPSASSEKIRKGLFKQAWEQLYGVF